MTPRTTVWKMADERLAGRLAERIAELREEGMSWREMSQVLYGEGVPVTHETLRNWARQLGIEPEVAAAS